ncbi:MAG: hypothetical protein WD972_02910 [Candidatus Andersenbacteria bacterium]
MTLRERFISLFFNKDKPVRSWLIATLMLIVLQPLLGFPIGILSLFFPPNHSSAIIFRLVLVVGIILLPTIYALGARLNRLKAALLIGWPTILVALWLITAPHYGDFHRSFREEFLKSTFPPYPGAVVSEVNHSLGNGFTTGPSSGLVFKLEEADKKTSQIIDYYRSILPQQGWLDRNPTEAFAGPTEEYWETQFPDYHMTHEDWFMRMGRGLSENNIAAVHGWSPGSSLDQDEYAVSISFQHCNDLLCRIDDLLGESVVFIVNIFESFEKRS